MSPKLSGQYVRERRPPAWRDPIRPGWPGPTRLWTAKQRAVFQQHYDGALALGLHDARAWAEAYGAVTRMPEGKSDRA